MLDEVLHHGFPHPHAPLQFAQQGLSPLGALLSGPRQLVPEDVDILAAGVGFYLLLHALILAVEPVNAHAQSMPSLEGLVAADNVLA